MWTFFKPTNVTAFKNDENLKKNLSSLILFLFFKAGMGKKGNVSWGGLIFIYYNLL